MCLQRKGDEVVNTTQCKTSQIIADNTLQQKNGSKYEQQKSSYLHQCHGLSGVYTFLVDENQDANDGTNKAEASHEAGYN